MVGRDECRAWFLLGLGTEMVIDPAPEQHMEAVG